MKKVLCVFLSIFVFLVVNAQDAEILVHKVQRGESLDYIATKYGVSLEQLQSHNPFLDKYFYVGQELNVPIVKNAIDNPLLVDVGIKPYIESADIYEKQKNYSEAQKIYTRCLQERGDNAYLHFRLGRCYYLRGKWKMSIRELEKVDISEWNNPSLVNEVKLLLADAREKRAEQLESRGEIWSAIGSALVTTAAITANAYVQTKTRQTSSTVSSSSTSSSPTYSSSSNSSDGSSKSSTSSKRCRYCLGTGKCSTCNGKGTFYPEGFGIHKLEDCPNCDGGPCTHCNGTGNA